MTKFTLCKVALSRRQVMAAGGSAILAVSAMAFTPGAAWASPEDAAKLVAKYTGGTTLKKGRIEIELPTITNKGPMTPITVSIDSPMTENNFVKAIHIVGLKNTKPEIASYFLCADCGKAQLTTRIRLRETQNVIVVAEMSDGSFWMGTGQTKVTAGGGGCG